MPLRLAIFDIAGTIVTDNDAVAKAFVAAFNNYGYDVAPETVVPLMGYKKTTAIEMVLQQLEQPYTTALINNIHEAFVRNMREYYRDSGEVEMMRSAEPVMRELKENGIMIAVNTGFSRAVADEIIDRFKWYENELIDDSIASDEVEYGRPDPAMINLLMQRLQITDPREVLKVGDTEVDIREGRNAGCALVVGVTTGAFTLEQLEPYSPDYIINDLSELPLIINQLA